MEPKQRQTIADLLPVGAWVMDDTGAGRVTESSARRALIEGLFGYGWATASWATTVSITSLRDAREYRHVTEEEGRAAVAAIKAKRAEAWARKDAERAHRETERRLAQQRERIVEEIRRRLDTLTPAQLDALEASLNTLTPITEALCSTS